MDKDKALLQAIQPIDKAILPGRGEFLSGLVSEIRPWSMKDLADSLMRALPPKEAAWNQTKIMKNVGDAKALFRVAHRLQPQWNVTYEDAAAVVSKSIESMVREGKIKVAIEQWHKRMGGELNADPVWMVGANLRGAKLSKRDLRRFILDRAKLEEANLEDSSIGSAVGANFSGANARKLNAVGANLTRAKFTDADLTEANFSEAILVGADFRGADLKRSRMRAKGDRGSVFDGTRMDGANLDGAIFKDQEEESSPWWSSRNPVFTGAPSGYTAVKILTGTVLAKPI